MEKKHCRIMRPNSVLSFCCFKGVDNLSEMYRLGKEGRAAQQRLMTQSKRVESFTEFRRPVSQAQNEVNLLLSILTNQDVKTHTSAQLLSYIVHYLPKVKNENNLSLLASAFLGNAIIFMDHESIDLNDTYLIIEAIKALFESKIKISEPTLPLERFFHTFIDTLYSSPIEPWKKTLVVTGILLTKPLYEEHAIPETDKYLHRIYQTLSNFNHELIILSFKNMSFNQSEINALVVISLACSLPFFSDAQKKSLPHSSILVFTVNLIFESPFGLSVGNTEELLKNHSPIIKHLSRLSFLVENCLVHGVDFLIMNNLLHVIKSFSEFLHLRISDTVQSWDFSKNILFAVIIIFQGYSSYLLNIQNGLKRNEIMVISSQIMESLYHLNFIIERIGTGGFKAYNFVYLTNLDALLQYSVTEAEEIGDYFISQADLNEVPANHYESSKVLFTLIYFESLAQHCSEIYYHNVISPFVYHFISTARPNQKQEFIKRQRSIIEASHSVVLSTFSIPKNSRIIASTAIPYLETVLSQFPVFLSVTQLRIAVESITKSIASPSPSHYLNKDNFRELLHVLYITILNTKPGIPLPTEQVPSTTRSALIHCLISIVPYIHVNYLQNWLDNIWELTRGSTVDEFNFLEDALWKVLSEGLDLQRGNIGIQWWYSRNTETAKL